MRYISIEQAKPGMMLARSIYDEADRILVGAYNELTEEFIKKLAIRGYPGFYIEDELSKDIMIQETISAELRNNAVKSLRECNVDAAVEIAKSIVDQIMNSKVISLDLLDLRTFDDYTYRHSVNVAVLATVIGMGMGVEPQSLADLCAAAILHDLGKIFIDKDILNKPGKLSPDEYDIIKTHARLSYDLIKDKWNVSAKTKTGVLFHHENEDGSGYPLGLEHEDIHIFAKIIHVADVYDALITKRPYKKAFSLAEAIEYLMGGCDILFDRNVVTTFLNYVPVYPKGVSVLLSDGREAIVVENHKHNTLRPRIRLENGDEMDLSDELKYRNITIVGIPGEEIVAGHDLLLHEANRNVGKKHILVVDDMVTNLKTMQGILEDNYKISIVKSGEQALNFVERVIPDLILMDIDMPGMDGIETVERIQKKFGEQIPIIFLTALADKDTVSRCKQVKACDYIIKPFKPVYILERISLALEG